MACGLPSDEPSVVGWAATGREFPGPAGTQALHFRLSVQRSKAGRWSDATVVGACAHSGATNAVRARWRRTASRLAQRGEQ